MLSNLFLEDLINFLSVECDKNNANGMVIFSNETEGFFNSAKCEFFTDSLAFVNLLKME